MSLDRPSGREACYLAEPVAAIGGEIEVPGDKSISHRALLLGAVAQGATRVRGFLRSDDCLATLAAVRALGVEIAEASDSSLVIHGRGLEGLRAPAAPLDLGNSGTAMRLLAGLLATQPFRSELTGDASLRRRPMERVAEPLRAMGARLLTQDGHAPLEVSGGRLHGVDWTLEVASAQVKSALLLAGLGARGRTRVRSPAPTRDHTERMLVGMGVPLEQREDRLEVTLTGPAEPRAIELEIPGDFSSAAFFIVAGCLGASQGLTIRNVGINPTRIGLLTALKAMGGQIEIENQRMSGAEPIADLKIQRSQLRGIDLPISLVPLAIDELPVLFVAAATAEGGTRVSGAEELRHKESDRLAVMAEGLRRLGIAVEERPDGLTITGGTFEAGTVDSHGDHRVAMAFAIAAMRAAGPVRIRDTAPVATSFPDFAATARGVGLRLEAAEGA